MVETFIETPCLVLAWQLCHQRAVLAQLFLLATSHAAHVHAACSVRQVLPTAIEQLTPWPVAAGACATGPLCVQEARNRRMLQGHSWPVAQGALSLSSGQIQRSNTRQTRLVNHQNQARCAEKMQGWYPTQLSRLGLAPLPWASARLARTCGLPGHVGQVNNSRNSAVSICGFCSRSW